MTTPDVTRVPRSPSAMPTPELPRSAMLPATNHGEGCECPACLWERLCAKERRDIRAAIDRRQAERRAVDRRAGNRSRQ